MKNKKFLTKFAIVLGTCLFIAIGAIIIFVLKAGEYKNQAIEAEYNLESNKRYCLVAEVDIRCGDIIDIDSNVMEQAVYTGLDSSYYITSESLPLTATVNIMAGTPVMTNMATKEEISNDTREYEISVANLMTDQKESDCIDIRIMFPNGEDYLVLSKKTIRTLHLDESIFYITLSEEEILRLASATIDAYTISGTRIYTTRYIEPSIQDEAIPTYPVRSETIDLLNTDPNILEIAQQTLNLTARLDLEQRLTGLTPEQLAATATGHGLTDTAQASVLTSKDTEDEPLNDDSTISEYDEEGNLITNDESVVDENYEEQGEE